MIITQEKKNLIKKSKYSSSDLLLKKIKIVQTNNLIEETLKKELMDTCKNIRKKELKEVLTSKSNPYFM